MESYKARWKALTAEVEPKKPDVSLINYYRERIKSLREGDYLVKVSKSNKWSGMGVDYIQFDYGLHGSVALGRRRDAAWFTKEEAHEFIKCVKKGFKVVKLSKNKK